MTELIRDLYWQIRAYNQGGMTLDKLLEEAFDLGVTQNITPQEWDEAYQKGYDSGVEDTERQINYAHEESFEKGWKACVKEYKLG